MCFLKYLNKILKRGKNLPKNLATLIRKLYCYKRKQNTYQISKIEYHLLFIYTGLLLYLEKPGLRKIQKKTWKNLEF